MTRPSERPEVLRQPAMKLLVLMMVLAVVVTRMTGAVVVLDKDPYSNLVVAVASDVQDCETVLNATLVSII